MADLFTGISGLKKISSLLKQRVNSSSIPTEKSGGVLKPTETGSAGQPARIRAEKFRVDGSIQLSGYNDVKIRNLVGNRLLCEQSLRVKRELGEFFSTWLSKLS